MAVGVTVLFSIRLGQQAAFMAALEAHIESCVTGDIGCLQAFAMGDPGRPGKVMLVQLFETEEQFDEYRASPLARAFDSAVVDIVTGRATTMWSEVVERGPAP